MMSARPWTCRLSVVNSVQTSFVINDSLVLFGLILFGKMAVRRPTPIGAAETRPFFWCPAEHFTLFPTGNVQGAGSENRFAAIC